MRMVRVLGSDKNIAKHDECSAALKAAIDRKWLTIHRSGVYVTFTQAGAELFA
jgi:predicted nucleic acid-binding Zn ribbon protein